MPWEKQFDETEVLNRATEAFLRGGYKGTSMKTLVAATGLNPGSIYAAFDDKRHLFERCLAHYEAGVAAKYAELARDRSPRSAILGLFDMMQRDVAADGGKGCLVVNSSLEAGSEPELAALVRSGLKGVEDFIRDRIAAGQASGEIPAGRDPAETARLVLAILTGARILARADGHHPFVAESRAHAERLLS